LAAADTIYVYRGPAGGFFAPAGALTAPVQQSFAQVDGRWRLADRAVLDGEFALSTQDRNTFSPLDDDDNGGNAGRLSIDLVPTPLSAFGRGLGELTARAEHRHLGDHFTSPGRIDASFTYDRDWNLPTRETGLAEDRTSGQLSFRPVRQLALLQLSGPVTATAARLRVDSAVDTGLAEGRLERQTANAASRVLFFLPSARYEEEERIDPLAGSGTRYRLAGGDLGVDALGPLRLSIGVEQRVDDRKPAAFADTTADWARETDAVTRRGSLSLPPTSPSST
ncbi:MAG: hypothetical protein FD129_3382, partial [bacterium]